MPTSNFTNLTCSFQNFRSFLKFFLLFGKILCSFLTKILSMLRQCTTTNPQKTTPRKTGDIFQTFAKIIKIFTINLDIFTQQILLKKNLHHSTNTNARLFIIQFLTTYSNNFIHITKNQTTILTNRIKRITINISTQKFIHINQKNINIPPSLLFFSRYRHSNHHPHTKSLNYTLYFIKIILFCQACIKK